MKEILFRAKQIGNREWIIGNLVLSEDADKGYEAVIVPSRNSNMFLSSDEKDLGFENWNLVDVDTVCQYTGLTDRNGRKIFEGDIVVQFADFDESGENLYLFYQIRWSEEYSAFEGIETYSGETFLMPDLEDIEVISNIFDNSEFLKGDD